MYVSLFDLKVDSVCTTDWTTTLRLTAGNGIYVTMFFNDLAEIKEFSRAIRRAVLDELDKQERAALAGANKQGL